MPAKEKDTGHEAVAAAVVKALPKAARDRVEVTSKSGMTNLRVGGKIVAAVRNRGAVRVFMTHPEHKATITEALTAAVEAAPEKTGAKAS